MKFKEGDIVFLSADHPSSIRCKVTHAISWGDNAEHGHSYQLKMIDTEFHPQYLYDNGMHMRLDIQLSPETDGTFKDILNEI